MTAREVHLPWHTFMVSIRNGKCVGGRRLLWGTARFREAVRAASRDLGRVESTDLELGRGLGLSGDELSQTSVPLGFGRIWLLYIWFLSVRRPGLG